MNSIFFNTIDWENIPATVHAGETGVAHWKTIEHDRFRMRVVEYSKDYKADHWCTKGHIVFCLAGEMTSELSDGRVFTISEGMSYQVSDDVSVHRSHSRDGVRLLIIDGGFLNNKKIANPWRM